MKLLEEQLKQTLEISRTEFLEVVILDIISSSNSDKMD
jgi:hypothetical protein